MKIRLCLPVWRGVRLRTKCSGREALVKLIRSASLSDEVIVGIHATGFHSKRVKAGDNPRDVAGKKPRHDICAIRLRLSAACTSSPEPHKLCASSNGF